MLNIFLNLKVIPIFILCIQYFYYTNIFRMEIMEIIFKINILDFAMMVYTSTKIKYLLFNKVIFIIFYIIVSINIYLYFN